MAATTTNVPGPGAEAATPSPPGARVSSELPVESGADPVARVLIVDDHPANLLALEGILAPLGQQCVRATSGAEALKRLLEDEYAVILMDVQMPGLDGLQTARIVRERAKTREVPIIFLTAISRDAAHVSRGYDVGAVDYLVKPLDPEILRSKVQVFVDLWQAKKRLERDEAVIRRRERAFLELQNVLRFQRVTDVMPCAVLGSEPDGSVYWCNAVYQRYTGLDVDAARGHGFIDAIDPRDRDRVVRARAAAISMRRPFEAEVRLVSREGTSRWFLLRAVPEREADDRVVGFIETLTDIHELRAQREDLAEFKATLDATIDSVLVIEADLRIAYANHGAVAQLGWSRDELLAMRIDEVEPGASEGELRSRIAPLRAGTSAASTYRTVRRTRSGEEVPVEVILQFVRTGATGRLVSVARDIRERLRAEEELRRANEAKDAFIAAASHELRTPLAAAKAQAQLAMRRLRSEAEHTHAGKALRTITGQIDRMTKLVDDLLDVSRVQIGRLSLELAELDLAALVNEVAERIQVLSDRHELRLSTVQGEVRLLGDRGRLDQVITNLLSNAIRYSPEGGPIDVELVVDDEWVDLVVRDRGIGIPPEEQRQIFEAFGRAHGSRYGGLGLGLTICHGIVARHGGEIAVESTGVPGEGSTFRVRLRRVVLSPPA